ncbi:MAG: hypothetical protein Tsb0014_46360 [Pleurocapsa sp.]
MKDLLRKKLYHFREFYLLRLVIRRPKYNGKVFCIGFNKTGTTSCGRALEMLGYKHSSFNTTVWRKFYKNNEIVKILQYTAKFDSVDDLPWLKEDMIPILDRVFPNSKFIYLTRDEESWQKSIYHWTYQKTGKYPNLEQELENFRKHRDFVLNYFKNRPKDQFLILDIKDEEGLKKLANFLGKTTNQNKFPHANKTINLLKKPT